MAALGKWWRMAMGKAHAPAPAFDHLHASDSSLTFGHYKIQKWVRHRTFFDCGDRSWMIPSHGGKSEAQARRDMSDTATQKLLNWAAEVRGDMKSTGGA
ncbi:MAG: hypothetical protein FRX49_02240 [Trebouxia sp. A1-2]|nr:MAG: hypothetical protein FRX49_02240 [Trebouxia sp. A1-2]